MKLKAIVSFIVSAGILNVISCQPPTIANCENMSAELDMVGRPTCTACKNGYFLRSNNYTCDKCAAQCSSCYGTNVSCLDCKPGYLYNPDTYVCSACIRGCNECTDLKTCDVCKSGFYRSSAGKRCGACTANCRNCTTDRVCQECINGFNKKVFQGMDICEITGQEKIKNFTFVFSVSVCFAMFLYLCCSSVIKNANLTKAKFLENQKRLEEESLGIFHHHEPTRRSRSLLEQELHTKQQIMEDLRHKNILHL